MRKQVPLELPTSRVSSLRDKPGGAGNFGRVFGRRSWGRSGQSRVSVDRFLAGSRHRWSPRAGGRAGE